MTSVSKIVYIDKLDNIVNKYSNTYHSTIKARTADLKFSYEIFREFLKFIKVFGSKNNFLKNLFLEGSGLFFCTFSEI